MSAHGHDVTQHAGKLCCVPAPPEPPPEEWASCSLCQVRSPLKAAFRFNRRNHCLCPACYDNEQTRAQHGALFIVAFWIALGAGAALLGGKDNAGWVFLNFGLLHVMQWVTIIPHEAGHALAARAMGLRVWHVIIGVGRRLGSWRIAGVRFDLHMFPLSGATICEVRDRPGARLRRLCVAAGGPLVNLLLLWIAIELGREAWLAEQFSREPAPVFTFIVANCLLLLTNLWPSSGAAGPTDGAQLLGLLLVRRIDFAALHRASTLYHIELDALHGDAARAIMDARAALRESPGDAALQAALSAALLNAERFGEARELLLQLLRESNHAPALSVVLYNNLAFANLNLEDPLLGIEARSLAAQAHRWMPWEPHVMTNLGCAEALFGDSERAVELLSHPRIAAHSRRLAAVAASALGFAYARLDKLAASQKALAAARAADPGSHMLKVVEHRLAASLPQPSAMCSTPPRQSAANDTKS